LARPDLGDDVLDDHPGNARVATNAPTEPVGPHDRVQMIDVESRELLAKDALALRVHLERVEHCPWHCRTLGRNESRCRPVEGRVYLHVRRLGGSRRRQRTDERAFQVDPREPRRPVHRVGARGLGRFALASNYHAGVEIAELDPALPSPVVGGASACPRGIPLAIRASKRRIELHQNLSHCALSRYRVHGLSGNMSATPWTARRPATSAGRASLTKTSCRRLACHSSGTHSARLLSATLLLDPA